MTRYYACAAAHLINLTACPSREADVRPIEQGLCIQSPNDPCCPGSPIILDLNGGGFALTNVQDGVPFDLNPTAGSQQVSWTVPGADDAWLVFDRNGNGIIDDGSELFGNFSPQTPSASPQGYQALAVWDQNHDGVIDSKDFIYDRLRLWQDRNHNGKSEEGELSPLAQHGIVGLDLRFVRDNKEDQYGNYFRYSARVLRGPGSIVGPFSYDVFLKSGPLDVAAQRQGVISMADVAPGCLGGGGGSGSGSGDGGRGVCGSHKDGINDPSVFCVEYKRAGVLCRAVCWAAGSAVCAAVASVCAVGTTVTIGGLAIPCTAAIIAACAAGGGAASICSDLVCPPN